MILNSFVYYILFCSSVLLYGIGFNRESVMCNYPKPVLFSAVKSYACVILTFALSFFINEALLIPLNIIELYPFFTLLIYITISVFFEIIIQVTTKRSSAEFAISFLTVLLALSEGLSIVEGILICSACLTSFYALIPVLYALDKRLKTSSNNAQFKQKCIILLGMVMIMIALYSFNISWLNSGVIK
ncbi:hypothetical protein [Treponema sp.]|uniref:hypothetical protein n=1 Tax=Treponema sp. TaxID=166 RepID=UPI00298E222C|nr:hypothetical protein [Treponema sp.]MCR5613278.1 hypothetical protein [Treponema sp.]